MPRCCMVMAVLVLVAPLAAGEGPGGVAGCVCWLSAKDLPRGPLAVWPDQTKSGSDFKQDAQAKQPVVAENEQTKVKGVKFIDAQVMSNGKNAFADKVRLYAAPEEQYHVFILALSFPEGKGSTLLIRGEEIVPKRTYHVCYDDEKDGGGLVFNSRGRKNILLNDAPGKPLLIETTWDGAALTATVNGIGKKVANGKAAIDDNCVFFLGKRPHGGPACSLIFEVMVFNRTLSPEEVAKVREYIKTTYAALNVSGI